MTWRAKAIIVLQGSDSPVRGVAAKLGVAIIELEPLVDQAAGAFTLSTTMISNGVPNTAPKRCREEDVALVLHTSGTTSRPKMVPLTHANVCTSANNIGAGWRLRSRIAV